MADTATPRNVSPQPRWSLVDTKDELESMIAEDTMGCRENVDKNRRRLLAAGKLTDEQNEVVLCIAARAKALEDYVRLVLAELEKLSGDDYISAELGAKCDTAHKISAKQFSSAGKLCDLTDSRPDNVSRLVALARKFPAAPDFFSTTWDMEAEDFFVPSLFLES
jgi:hypothetical protein